MKAKSIKESKVEFLNMDFKRMTVYIFLILGREGMVETGLEHLIPVKINPKYRAQSLAATSIRDMENWKNIDPALLDNITKRNLVALMVKIAILVMVESTCYSFGGFLYRQLEGSGIELRGSACLAKLLMGQLDQIWANN